MTHVTLWVLNWIGVFYGFFLGSCLASFGCVVAERVPAKETIGGRSHCACGRQLKIRENIPVAGWLAVRGRARCCGAQLPFRYLGWELAYGVWGGIIGGYAWHQGVTVGLSGGAAVVCAVAFVGFFGVLVRGAWRKPAVPTT